MENSSSDSAQKYSSKILLRRKIFQLLSSEINTLRWIHAEKAFSYIKENIFILKSQNKHGKHGSYGSYCRWRSCSSFVASLRPS